MSNYGVIGDCHLGFKSYGSDRRSQETIDIFKQALELLKDKEIILFAGDFLDDTVIPNWIKKQLISIKESYPSTTWVITGGNHDSTKTYSSVSALDVLAELPNVIVVNQHKPETIRLGGLSILCIPHLKSQKEFLTVLDELQGTWDIALLHALVNSDLMLGPNDLNIDLFRLSKLAEKVGQVYIGHTHKYMQPLPNVIIPGSTLEFDFGQLGDKYVFTKDSKILLTQPRKMIQLDNIDLDTVLEEDCIYKISIKDIPIENYSNVRFTCDLIEQKYNGDIFFDLYKLGHKELAVTAIDASFDLMQEFKHFTMENNIPSGRMENLLLEAITKVVLEEED